MGWDANAANPRTFNPISTRRARGDLRCVSDIYHRRFRLAAARVRRQLKKDGLPVSVDGYLRFGSLDCSGCGRVLIAVNQKNGGMRAEGGWSRALVREIAEAETAWAYVKMSAPNPSLYWSAYHFIKACADLGLAVSFSGPL